MTALPARYSYLLGVTAGVVVPQPEAPRKSREARPPKAQRVPLVTAASDGPKQYVHDGEDGLMVPIDDAAALAEAIRRVTSDADLCARLTEKGFQRYQAEFTKINTVSQYLAYYHEMLKTEGLTAVV